MTAQSFATFSSFMPQITLEGLLRQLEIKFNTAAPASSEQANASLTVEEAGRILGPGFRVLKAIGHGATTSVFMVLTEMGILQAYKIGRVDRAEQFEAIQRAVGLLWSVYCPGHLLGNQAIGFCQNRNYFYIATPLLDSNATTFSPVSYTPKTLHTWLAARQRENDHLNRADTLTFLGFLIDVLKGLEFLHGNGLCMNDLHPANLGFFGGKIVLIDFSSITSLGAEPHEGAIWYAAPEGREATPVHDCYSVVKILIEGLWDVHPAAIQPIAIQEICEKHSSDLAGKLVSAIACHGLSLTMQERYQAAGELIRDLEELQKLLSAQA